MKYIYTLYKQDGTKEKVAKRPTEMPFADMYKHLNCSTIELLPNSYLPDELARREGVTAFADEEARFNSENLRNPHFKVLHGNEAIGEPKEWDVVGDIMIEEQVNG